MCLFSIIRYVHVEMMTIPKLLNALYVIRNIMTAAWEYHHQKSMQQRGLFVLHAGIYFYLLINNDSTDGKPHLELARRSARKASKKRRNVSSSLYLGYVEDDESVDAIMKKFECLEEYQKKKKICTGENGEATEEVKTEENKEEDLSTKDLEEIFKMTSSFTVEALDDEDLYTDEINSDTDNYDVNEESSESDEEFYHE